MEDQWNHKILTVDEGNFEAVALEIFQWQYRHNQVYRQYADALHIDPLQVLTIAQIPFLPIRFFKSHQVKTGLFDPAIVFESSGTTGMTNSQHLVKDVSLYEASFLRAFEQFYGPVRNWCIIGLLPSYLERSNSSLVYMVNRLINDSHHPQSGFYLHEHESLLSVLEQQESAAQPTLLIGVTFGLLDFVETCSLPLRHTIVMETGGMKGRRKEMIRDEVHAILANAFAIDHIHSEYGMTELLSQAYSAGRGLFRCPAWMKIVLRDEEDPLLLKPTNVQQVSGVINVIDLANVHSCSFIATDDIGRRYGDGQFEVLGRMDNSDLRGCSLLVV